MSAEDDERNAVDSLKERAAALDLDTLIRQGTEMADLLGRIAQREEHENPTLATKAAQAAVRAYTEGVSGVILAEQIKQVRKDVDELMAGRADPRNRQAPDADDDIIGIDEGGNEVRRPTWGRLNRKERTD